MGGQDIAGQGWAGQKAAARTELGGGGDLPFAAQCDFFFTCALHYYSLQSDSTFSPSYFFSTFLVFVVVISRVF